MAKRRALRLENGVGESPVWAWTRSALALLAAAGTVVLVGWRPEAPLLPRLVVHQAQLGLIGAYLVAIALPALRPTAGVTRVRFLRDRWPQLAVAVGGLALGAWWQATAVASSLLLAICLLRLIVTLLQTSLPPGVIFVGSFGAMIVLGAAGLMLPAATPPGAPIGPVDALFTSTSAVCVTGLIVRDTSTEFTRTGQWVILALIQLGGLGIIFFGGLMVAVLGSSLGLRASRGVADTHSEAHTSPAMVLRLIVFVALTTFLFEAVGAFALYYGWPDAWAGSPGDAAGPAERAFHAAFFAVSAFCNAGFATTPNSVEGLRLHWTTHVVIAGLIVVGGLGFPALENLWRVLWARVRGVRVRAGALVRINLHTRIVVVTTLLVYTGGFALLLVDRLVAGGQPLAHAALDAHFMSVSPRTAGFDTVAPSAWGPLGRFTMTVLMFIGGSPSGTAGGLKTVALAVLVVTVYATITGRPSPRVFKREIPDETVRKAATLLLLGFAMIIAIVAVLTVTESEGGGGPTTEALIFETVSACSTVGLTMDLTPKLSVAGRLAITAGMFLGRVGPLALLAALVAVTGTRRAHYEYPREGVALG